jgi:hypothetical protein
VIINQFRLRNEEQPGGSRAAHGAFYPSHMPGFPEGKMVNILFIALLIAAGIHILEEYLFPGGFAEAFNKLIPRASHLFTVEFHIVVNGVFILICILAAIIGRANYVLSMSAFGLVFANAMLHIRGAIIRKGYYPGGFIGNIHLYPGGYLRVYL